MATLRMLFAVAAYFGFFAAFVYLVGFVGNLIVPRSIDIGPEAPLAFAVVTDLALVALFGLQHSVMARPVFKRALARFVHPAIERSVYVLATVAVLVILYALWVPIPALVWSTDNQALTAVLWGLFALGWGVVFVSTWLLNHFELFGLQQAWLDMRGRTAAEPQFREPLFYRYVRHPLYLGFLLAFWATPTMTVGHALFAAGMTVYILIAIRYEERDLTAMLGEAYTGYRARVGMLIPGVGKVRVS
jgi:methanethiol S-methyltransferase